MLQGEGVALAGMIMGYVGIALMILVIPILAAIAIPSFVVARETAQTNVCLNNLRMIDSALDAWAIENNKADDEPVTFEDLTEYLSDISQCPVPEGSYTDIEMTVDSGPECTVHGALF